MNTNGTLFTQKHAELCKKYGVDVSLSLDGSKDIHDSHRSNSFDDVMATVSYLNQEKIKYGLITVIDDLSFNQREELYNFFKKTGLSTKINKADGYISHKKYTDFLIYLSKKLKEDNNPFREYTLSDIENTINGKLSHCVGCAWSNCYRDFIAIDYGGNVAMCERFFGFSDDEKSKYLIGNVNEPNIINIIYSEKYNNFQNTLSQRKFKCMSCHYYKYCGGGCAYDEIISGDVKEMCESRKHLFSNLIGG